MPLDNARGKWITKMKSMRHVIGYFLFVLSFMAWAAIAILPFLNLSIDMSAAITTALIVGGEIAFFLSIALLGKEFLGKVKKNFRVTSGRE
jgi:hypothetical protein